MSAESAQTLSAQEQAIQSGKKVMHGTATDRVLRLFEAIRSSGQPRVALERGIYFTESFKATEGQPLNLRWAKALKHITEKISVAIFDDELIVGRPCTWFGRYTLVYPEYAERTHNHEANWVQTIPGKGWNTLLRLYGPLEPWLNKTWQLRRFFDKVSFTVFLIGYTATNRLLPLAAKS